MLYDTPPKIKPVAVAGIVWVTLNASTRIEKVNAMQLVLHSQTPLL
jgi:hypothetical protein